MNKTTILFSKVLGTLAGLMGFEHGIGEILQSSKSVPHIFILSWPDSAFFKILGGEPAMTLFNSFLLAGIFSIVFSSLFLLIIYEQLFKSRKFVLLALTILGMLLSGAGFGPPLLGIVVLLIQLKSHSSFILWTKIPRKLHVLASQTWKYLFALCLAGWLMLFPGAPIVNYFLHIESLWLMIIPLIIAFCTIPFVVACGFSRDIICNAGSTGS